MKRRKILPLLTFGFGLALGVAVGIGMLIGVNSANSEARRSAKDTRLHAAAANGGKSLAMATGKIDDDVEGLFVLDFLTGDLYCLVVSPRALGAGFIGQFKTNILRDLGLEKGKSPDYILTTGNVRALRGGGAAKPAACIAYVGDGNSGNVAAYMIAWNPNMAAAGRPQIGGMITVAKGKARPTLEQD